MSLVGFFETLKNKEIKLNLDGRGNIRVIGRRDRLDPALLAEMKEKKDLIVDWLKEETMMLRPEIVPQPRKTNELPTSFAQQRLWFIDQMGGGSPQYNIPSAWRIEGQFNEDIAERALRRIIERHEPLRTVFREGEDGPIQHIRETFDFQLQRIDLSRLKREEQEQRVREAANADAARPFDLSGDLMLRASFLRLWEDEGLLLFNMHHIASDGWSMNVLVSEFNALYEAFSKGEADPLPPLEVQYADYAQWQREWLEGEVLERQLSYWEQQLAELPQVHGLPLDHPRPAVQTFNGAIHTFELDGATLAQLKQLALQEQVTLFMVLQGVFALLLSRHTNSHDIVIGTPVANRLQKELAPLVGFFVNTLVLRTDCRAGRTFREYLRQLKRMNLNAQANQDVPFEYLVERLKPQRSTSHAPLFQIMFSMNTNEAGAASLHELRFTPLGSDSVAVKFDLLLDVLEDADELRLFFAYNTDLFAAKTIERLGEHFGNLARGVAANADEQIERLPLLSESEQQHLLYELNETVADYAREACLHELFETQVARQPEAVALVSGDRQLSYRELNEQANQLAHYLREQGVGPDVLVGLCVERSLAMVVGMLGILKAGGAYVPLDPSYPQERLEYMIADSAPAVVLTQDLLAQRLPLSHVRTLRLDADKELLSGYPTHNLRREEVGLTSANLVYVIYTSGSTGKPKGVMLPHSGIVNCITWMQETYKLDPSDKFLGKTSLNFDPSVWELLWTLSVGAAVVLAEQESHFDTGYLKQLIITEQVTSAYFVPSMLSMFLAEPGVEQCRSLKRVISGGESLTAPTIHSFYELLEAELHHSYGPTETSIAASEWTCPPDAAAVAIGRPLANTQLYVLDASQQLAPLSVAGELYVGGVAVGRGYLNRPELTAERFVPDPFSQEAGQRMYRTGDVVRYWRDGNLEFIARTDDQVKVRGFRIELGEIQHQLEGLPNVKTAVVIAREDEPGEKKLVAYVTLENHLEAERHGELIAQLRRGLLQRLPEYMLPAAFVILEALPLTANGKVDRKALPAPGATALGGEYVAPATETEIALAEIWGRLLKLDPHSISATANFFELGGHSLLSIRLVTQIRAQWNTELHIRDIFEAAQLSSLALVIERKSDQVVRPRIVPHARETNELPTSFAQQRLWFIDQLDGGSPQYNMPGGLRIQGSFNEDIAERALRRIIERHEPLRTVFLNKEDGPVQHIRESFDFHLTRHDLSSLSSAEQEQRIMQAANADAAKPFDLSADLMLRAAFMRLSEDEGVLLFNMHHIASDGWSMNVLVSEFNALYQAFAKGEADPLPPLEVQYADYAQWQREWLGGEVLERQLAYWEEQLAELPQVHGLPLDHPRPAVQTFNGAIHTFELDGVTLAQLKQLALSEQATLFMVLQGVFALLLSRHSNSHDIVIGTPVANRLQQELESLVGFFVNTLVLRADCSAGQRFRDYLRHIKRINLDAQANQDVPFEYLVERLKPQRSTSHTPLFQIMFNMNTTEAQTGAAQSQELELTPLRSERVAVKFDLTLDVLETADGLQFSFAYNTDLFAAETIERLGEHFQNLARGVAANATERIEQLPLLSESEQQHLLYELNDTAGDYPRETCLHELFEAQVELRPEAAALVSGDRQLTYGELNEQANQLAHYLREQGVGPGTLVGLCVERSLAMVVGLLGILKAGGAYIPLDPSYPQEQLLYLINDSAPAIVLTQASLESRLPVSGNVRKLLLDADRELFSEYPTHNPQPKEVGLTSKDLAYVIYTSGSTGRPKGVMVEHASVVNLALNLVQHVGIDTDKAWAWVASYAFDASVKGLAQLMTGRPLLIVGEEDKHDPRALLALLERHRPGVIDCTPSLLELWLSMGLQASLPDLVIGGEAIAPALWNELVQWQQQYGRRALNVYGPTECCVDTTGTVVAGETPHIGRPWRNVRCYVLSAGKNLVPKGSVGELYIGGEGLARGYLNQPQLTAERFVHVRLGGDDSETRLYKTGDLVRYLADGNLEFIERADDQVKVRGFRIELGEIQHQLEALPNVNTAVVIAREDEPGDKKLVAYVTLENNLEAERHGELIIDLRRGLEQRLPEYMLPSAFVILEALPLTANGKVDRKALPAPGATALGGEYVAPATETEMALAEIWGRLLKVDPQSISATANFFELGGHSLLSIRLLTQIRAQWNVELQIRDIFEAPQLSSLAVAIERNSNQIVRPRIVPHARETNELPTSFAQQRLWFIDQLDGGSPQYNMPGALRIQGSFNEDIAERALRRIIERHEPLRTVFRNSEDGPVQHIRESFDFHLTRHDLSSLSSAEQEQRIMQAANADAAKPFDLSADLMLRAAFMRLSEDEGVLLFNMHHIASDGWSMNVLVSEFNALYEAFAKGEVDPLKPLEVQYADYAQWQREWLEGEVLERQLSYWEQQLAELPQVHGLPLDHPRPAVQTFNGAIHTFELDGVTLAQLKQLALQEQATLFMVLQGVFALLLARHSNRHDIVIGTPVANRLQQELESLVGFFVNTLVLRADCSAGQRFRDYLRHIKRINLDAQANQDVPFEYLVERLKPQRSTSHTPLFQIMFNMNTTDAETGAAQLQELELTSLRSERVAVKFDLVLDVMETADGLQFNFAYNTDLFDESTIVGLGEHFQNLARGVAANATERIEQLPLLSESEQQHLLYELNETVADYASEACLHELFEAQVARRPEAVALVYGDRRLSYRELNEQANQVAHYLSEQGVGPDVLVGLCVERSPAMVVGMLGILKAGGAYVPLDPSYPQERLEYMIADSAPAVVLTQDLLAQRLSLSDVRTLRLDADKELLSAYPTHNLKREEVGLTSANLVYVIYTSGSTGKPKGVMLPHSGIVNCITWMQETYKLDESDKFLGKTSLNFDPSVWELLWTLSVGAAVVLAEQESHFDTAYLKQLIITEQVTSAYFVPSMLSMFLAEPGVGQCRSLKRVISGGESLSAPTIHSFHELLEAELHHSYGPTETSIAASEWTCPPDAAAVAIGRPLANTQLYVLDASQQVAPLSVAGELYVGGVAVGRGYLNRPELTAERFVPDPFSQEAGQRMYRTGDVVRYWRDGNLEFIARTDDQVKVRGFRIELGEIQHQLEGLPNVKTAVVLAREDEPGEKKLVAYVTLEENLEAERHGELIAQLRRGLLQRLPEYMLPAAFVILEALPLTANGKVDRKALPAPGATALGGEYVAPATETEIALAEIWGRLLKLDPHSISASANFFELGGHSLLSVRLLTQIRAQWNVELQIRDIFEAAELSSLAVAIERNSNQVVRPRIVPHARETNELPTSFAQQRLWFIDQLDGGSPQYNMPGGLRIRGRFSDDIAERALRRIIERHEPLRTVFRNSEDGPVQHIRESFDFHLTRHDLSSLSSAEQEQRVMAAANADAAKPFDLSADLMLRAAFMRLSEDEGVLLFNMHHIASDGWSMNVLVSEFNALYEAFSKGEADPLPPLEVQYADYAQWQREWLAGEVLERQLSYWEEQLADLPQVHGLPLDHPRPAVQTFNGAIHTFELDGATLAQLKQLALQEQATLFMVLQGVFALLLSRHSNSHDIVIGTPVANRLQKELEPLVGFFVNTLVLRTDTRAGRTFREYLAELKRMNLDAQANQDVPFEYLVERLKPQRSTSHTPLFQIMFNMNTTEVEMGAAQSQELELTPLRSERVAVKFDLTLGAMETADELRLSFAYNTDLFDDSTIVGLGEHFQNLARGVAANATERIEQLPLLSESEQQHLLYELNETVADYAREACLHELFETQVARQPEAVALVSGDRQLSYRELNEQANQLAHYLREQGVGPDVLVGLCVERSLAMVVGMLGILKAGGAYVPLDPSYPQERLEYMIADSEPAVVLTQDLLAQRLPLSNVRKLRLDADKELLNAYPTHNLRREEVGLTSANLAYVIYTSGSTGKPKGVMLPHSGIVNCITWMQETYKLDESDKFLGKTSLNFDPSVWELLWTLSVGAAVVLAEQESYFDTAYLKQLIITEHVTSAYFVPSMLSMFLAEPGVEQCRSLKRVISGGESLTAPTIHSFYELLDAELHHSYGPTETSIAASEWTCPADAVAVAIGRPLANTQLYVLDASQQLAPLSVAGELYVGGVAVGRGYLNRPELTAERFVPDPFSKEAGQRMYRTGDVVRYWRDGNLEFIARTDDQVKVRGFRIELGEIQHQLEGLPDVKTAVVIAREDEAGEKRLVAYVSLQNDEELKQSEVIAGLRQQLQLQLPDYMLPARFVIMDQWPLTATGKIDRKKLPAPDHAAPDEEYVAPTTETEATLQKLWQEVLAIPSISVTANFFESGGHSILAMHLIKQSNNYFGREILEIRDIFKMQTIREMASYLDQQQHTDDKQTTSTHPNLLELRKQQAPAQPLFLIHAVGGYAHSYQELALNLDYPGAVFGLQSDDNVPGVIEAMAQRYLEAIRLEQPHGSYLLGGWSMGGVVAYEIARQLIAAGERVNLLMMFDSFCPNTNAPTTLSSVNEEKIVLRTMAAELGITDEGLSLSQRAALDGMPLPKLMSLMIQLGKEQNRLPAEFGLADLTKRYQMVLKNSRAVYAYRAQPLDVDIQLIRAQENRNRDWSLGWNSVARKVTVRELRGDHFSLLRKPNVFELGKVVSKLMSPHAMQYEVAAMSS